LGKTFTFLTSFISFKNVSNMQDLALKKLRNFNGGMPKTPLSGFDPHHFTWATAF
jgi:hypothetical protein